MDFCRVDFLNLGKEIVVSGIGRREKAWPQEEKERWVKAGIYLVGAVDT